MFTNTVRVKGILRTLTEQPPEREDIIFTRGSNGERRRLMTEPAPEDYKIYGMRLVLKRYSRCRMASAAPVHGDDTLGTGSAKPVVGTHVGKYRRGLLRFRIARLQGILLRLRNILCRGGGRQEKSQHRHYQKETIQSFHDAKITNK